MVINGVHVCHSTWNICTQHNTVRKSEKLVTMSSELLSLPCWSCFLIVSCCPSGCHAILLHQDSQMYDEMTSPSLKKISLIKIDLNWPNFLKTRTCIKIKLWLNLYKTKLCVKGGCLPDTCPIFTHESTAGCISFVFLEEFKLPKHCKTNCLLNS